MISTFTNLPYSLSLQSVFLTSYLGFLRRVTAPPPSCPSIILTFRRFVKGFFWSGPFFLPSPFFLSAFAASILPVILITGRLFVKPFFRRGLTFFSTIFIRILNILGLCFPVPFSLTAFRRIVKGFSFISLRSMFLTKVIKITC